MSAEPWSLRPKVDELSLTDVFMRRVPTSVTKSQEIAFIDVEAFLLGSAQTLVASEADLPPTINGFHTLDQTKNYTFTEANVFFDPILIPAGYIGWIKSTFLSVGSITYLGAGGSFFNTLNLAGTIVNIEDAGGGAITITTSAPHGLLDGQFVNITGSPEPSYNQQRLQITFMSTSRFSVQIPFVTLETTGAFDTGFDVVLITDVDFTCPFTADLFDLTSSGSLGSNFTTNFITEFGFLSPGIVRNCPVAGIRNGLFGFLTDGLILDNCLSSSIFNVGFISLDPSFTAARGLIFQGASSARVVVDVVALDMSDPAQRPIKLDPSLPSFASVTIQNSPDNLVAVDYYDTLAGGLDQTDPRVIALNNGPRANSMTLAEARIGIALLEVDGSGGPIDPVPIVDITPTSIDWIQDTSTEEFTVDTTTGLTTYNGLRPISVKIEYSFSVSPSSGPSQTLVFDLRINGVKEAKSSRTLISPGSGTFASISYDGGNFDILPGDTFQIFKNNQTNGLNTDVTDGIMLITKN